MPIVPGLLDRLMGLRLNRVPGVLLDFLGAQAFRVVCVALKLGVFEALAEGPLGSSDVARRIQASERGTALLLDALEALGYVRCRDGRYGNTSQTTKWLLRASPWSMARGLPFFESMVFDRWQRLDESIRRGRPAHPGYEWLEEKPGRWRTYQEAMLALARIAAPEVTAKVRLGSGARRLLDVGGGHGWYSIALCRRYPDLSATVFDVPPAVVAAREVIRSSGLSDRVEVQEGDFWKDGLGSSYDVALAFNILHAHWPDQNVRLLRRIGAALNPRGCVVILDQVVDRRGRSLSGALARLQGLNYFNDLDGQTYAFKEIAAWIEAAGFGQPRRVRLRTLPGSSLVTSKLRR